MGRVSVARPIQIAAAFKVPRVRAQYFEGDGIAR